MPSPSKVLTRRTPPQGFRKAMDIRTAHLPRLNAVFTVPDKVSSADQIVGQIVRGLYEGQYVAGQKLTEADLTQRFSVGRGTVREALKRLQAEGLVTVSLHKGASIRALSRDDVRDILEVVEALAGLAAKLAAERISRSDEKKMLRQIMSALKTLAANDGFEFGRQRGRFYLLLAQIAGNRELGRLLPMVQAHLLRVQFRPTYGIDAQSQLLDDYERVAEAILENEGPKAERAMRQHIRNTLRTILQLPDRYFARPRNQ